MTEGTTKDLYHPCKYEVPTTLSIKDTGYIGKGSISVPSDRVEDTENSVQVRSRKFTLDVADEVI